MEGALKGLFGGGASGDTSQAHDFIQRVTTGDQTQGYSDQEAHAAVNHVLQNAPPATVQSALEKSVNNLSEEQRGQFAQMLQQRNAQGRTADAGGGPTIQRSSDSGAQSGSSGGSVGDILGGLLGGGGAGGMLGGLLGGNSGQAQTQSGTAHQSGAFGGIGDLMSNPIGKAVMAGMAAFAMKEVLNK